MAIGTTIKKARKKAGLTIRQAAETIGISEPSFSRMENGYNEFSVQRLLRLAELYDVSPSALLENSIVAAPSKVDLNRMRQVVETVQAVVNRMKARTSPEKMGLAVSEVYRIEIEHIIQDPKAEFDPKRHQSLIEAMFRK
ncbi:transcriptional regulator with XRE-family HTH domain [Roseibium hamelinense]|uniref:Transcriptional regulator with XRE-family HTH domain n=1 Tax=Roseibium hamelinense TaxID=150831 RepID=A0A562SL39_9HYPH|nr:helix-turn-helix transcriptional regulator [Roseibium hamelinense]TWI81908.1 transcriptional regulator with XRE-family HTH domain [Roseibium hamelinense]